MAEFLLLIAIPNPIKTKPMKTSYSTARMILFVILISLVNISSAQSPTWSSRGVGGGGALFFPTINPGNDNEFYVACDMSQLFHSTDFGLSYSQVSFTKFSAGSMSTYEFTSNSTVAYCIANDGNINYPVRTLDGGTTWSSITNEPLPGEDVYALKADYDNPGRIVINYYSALYISQNNGNSFTLIKNATDAGVGITLAGIFFDGNNIYIGTNEGVLYSSNGGSSFAMLSTSGMPAAQRIFSFAGAKSGATTRFLCIAADAADIYNGIAPYDYGIAAGVYSMDAGTNVWSSKSTGITFSNDNVMYVGMAKNDISIVYLGGNDASTGGNLVMKTTNAGTSWSKIFSTTNNANIITGWSGYGGDRGWGYGESCFGITVAPNNVNKVLFGDFGFVHKTSDGGTTWQQAYVSTSNQHPAGSSTPQHQYYNSIGIENTTAWQVYWQDANDMFAAFSDIRGIRSQDAGTTWSFDYTGHTANSMYRIGKHISGSTMFAATSGIHDMYQSTRLQDNTLDATDNEGKIIYSANNGATWQLLHLFSHPVFWIATDPNNANRMYASVIHYSSGTGQGGIWVTNDLNNLAASTWTKLSNPPRTQGHPASIVVLNDGKVVCTYSGRRTSGGSFTASSGVFIYDPSGGTWTDVSDAGMQYWTKDIVIDPADPAQNTWYVCVFSGWGGAPNGLGGLYKTTNRGSSWTKLTGSQFDRVTSITFNPTQTTQAYLTTETQGLWISNDMNNTTPTWSLVSDYSFRQPERVFFNPYNTNEVWVTSFGNGLKMTTLGTTLPIRLLSFSGNRVNDKIDLKWITASEDAGDKFYVERSTDGLHFENIGTMDANKTFTYGLTDLNASPVLYYRLKISSITGRSFYSNTILLKKNIDATNEIKLLNNPVSSSIPLQIKSQRDKNIYFVLTDLSGRRIMTQSIGVTKGISYVNILVPAYCSRGNYILKIRDEDISKALRIAIIK